MQHVPPYTYCSLFSVALCRASFVPLAEHTQHSRYCSRQNISILMCFDKATINMLYWPHGLLARWLAAYCGQQCTFSHFS